LSLARDRLSAIKQHWPSIPFFEGDGAIIFKQACSLGCEGIASKRLGPSHRSGRVNDWLEIKNPAAPAA
jgi:ATP-dependent DNA ligase